MERSDDSVQAFVVTHRHFDSVFLIPAVLIGALISLFALILAPYLFPFILVLVGALLILAGLAILL